MNRFPWAALMRVGLGELRLPPPQFWSMSLRELAAALPQVEAPMRRDELERLMQRFPDEDNRHPG